MLVLSRKRNQRIDFPNLGIAVEILRISGNTVRVGVDAPRDEPVLRGELVNDQALAKLRNAGREERHAFRNHLNAANLGLHLLEKQLDAGRTEDAEATLSQVLATFAELDGLASAKTVSRSVGQNQDGVSENKNGRRALVVEDNANERELLSGYLRLCGYNVDSVEDGLAAMTYLSKNDRPDIVLLDMQMPRMDGPGTISAIRRNPAYRGIKLFAISGMDRHQMQVPLGRHGVDRWFAKPLKPAEFTNELEAEMTCGCAVG